METNRQENELAVTAIKDQWQVYFARFIVCPSLASTAPSLIPLRVNRRNGAPLGNWIATSLPAATLQILTAPSGSEPILTVCLSDKILEEHYISKLHFSWPQVKCIPEFPARGSRTVFVSYKDPAEEIQKFALRFSTLHEAESFINVLKENLECEDEIEPVNKDFGSEFSTQSELISRACQELSDMTPGDSYTPQLDPSLSYEIERHSSDQNAILSHNSEGIFPALPPGHNSECIFPALPPSFTSLLSDCYSTAKQAANQPTVSEENDLKSQIVKYMEDSSFQDMLRKVEKIISEIGGDDMLQ